MIIIERKFQMKIQNRSKGSFAENIAAKYLAKNGWEIIEMNFSIKWGEIDIIASKDDVLSFVEVKAKTSDQFGTPEEMINRNKIFQIRRIADLYLEKHPKLRTNFTTFRIDAIAIVLEGNEVKSLNHYENVGAEFS